MGPRGRRQSLLIMAVAAMTVAALPSATGTATAAPSRTAVLGGAAAVPDHVGAQLDACTDGVARYAGRDRFATAVAVAASLGRADGPVYLASGTAFPDALTAAPLVAARGGALLLTAPEFLPEATRADLVDRDPTEVVVLGGPAAVADDVVDEVADVTGVSVRRLAGADRFATAATVADRLGTTGGTVYVASGLGFADALAVGAAAGRDGAPILLVTADTVPDATAEALERLRPDQVVVVGGAGVVGTDVADALGDLTGAAVRRVAGPDRFATAARLAADTHPDAAGAYVATGTGFADALAAGPAAAAAGAPLLLTAPTGLDAPTGEQLARLTGHRCRVVTVRPDATEALTLGASTLGGTRLAAQIGPGRALLGHAGAVGAVLLDGAATADFAYPTPAGGVPAVTWTQPVDTAMTDVVARQPWREDAAAGDGAITLAWQYTGDSARYRDEVAAAPGLTITAPFRYFLASDGELRGGSDSAFIADMHARGVDVWPTIHTAGEDAIHAALSDPARRADYARRIAANARANGADGVNIDIEGFRVADRGAVTDFVEQVSEHVHAWGGVTSFDFTVMTDTWATPPAGYEFWSTGPDRRAISAAVDYAVLMAYDQFNRFRPAGPVASPAWVEEALRYQLRFSDPHRVLLGVPLYGRVWRGDTPSAVGIGTIERHAREGVRTPDPRFDVDRIDLADGRYTWAETVDGLRYRLDLVDAFGLAGTASWRLGFDVPEVWDVLGR